MPGPVYRDSLGRCEPSSMLYDTIRNPNAPNVPPKPVFSGIALDKDTMESTQQRLNREMLERLQRGGLRLPHESFVAVVQIGKYLFLAIMLPPYLCLYGIPRWLILSALPQIFAIAKNECLRVGRFMNELSKRLADLMKGLMEQMIGDALKMTKHHAKNLFRPIHSIVQHLTSAMSIVKKGWERLTSALHQTLLKTPKDFLNSRHQGLNKAIQKAVDKITQIKNKIVRRGIDALHAISQILIAPIATLLTSPINTAKAAMHSLRDKFAHASLSLLNRVHTVIETAAEATRKRIKNSVMKCKKWIQDLAQPVIDTAKDKIENIRDFLLHHWNLYANPVIEGMNALRNKMSQAALYGIDRVKNTLQMIPSAFVQGMALVWNWTPASARQRLARFSGSARRWSHSFNHLARGVIEGVKTIINTMKKLKHKAAEWCGWLIRHLHQFIRWLTDQLITLPQRTWQGMIAFGKLCMKVSSSMILMFRYLFACIWAAFGYGILLIRELQKEIEGWLRPS